VPHDWANRGTLYCFLQIFVEQLGVEALNGIRHLAIDEMFAFLESGNYYFGENFWRSIVALEKLEHISLTCFSRHQIPLSPGFLTPSGTEAIARQKRKGLLKDLKHIAAEYPGWKVPKVTVVRNQ
jgi:hypothetical protein